MISADTITRKEAKQLVELLIQWTRAEIMARHAPIPWPSWGAFHKSHWDIENDIRKLIFDTDHLFDIGVQLGLLNSDGELLKQSRPKKKKKVRYNRSKRRQ